MNGILYTIFAVYLQLRDDFQIFASNPFYYSKPV